MHRHGLAQVPRKTRQTQEIRSEKSRARILVAAEQAFARDGLAGARTDAIAADAGVNKALLYYYFKDKESLYEAVIERHLQAFNDQALGILGDTGSPRLLLLRYIDLHFDFISSHRRHAPLFQQFMSKAGKFSPRLVTEYILPRAEAVRKLIARGVSEGEFRRVDPFHAAVSIAALIVFYFTTAPVLQAAGHGNPYSKPSLAKRKREVRDFVCHGLFKEGAKP